MPTIKYKPTTPARRHMSVPSFEEITKFTPEKSLLATKSTQAVTPTAESPFVIRAAETVRSTV